MSYEQEKELRLSFEPYTAATTGAVGKKRVSIFGVASRCITSDMLQTFKKQIILQWHDVLAILVHFLWMLTSFIFMKPLH